MPHAHCRNFVVDDPTDLLREISRMPILYWDDASMGQIEGTEQLETMLVLSGRHGRGVIFHCDELGPTQVRFHWLGVSSAIALLTTPEGMNTLFLHLSGFDPDEEELAAHYLHEITKGNWSLGEVRPPNRASCLIEFDLSGVSEFSLLSKVVHGTFFGLCEDAFQQRFLRRGNLQG